MVYYQKILLITALMTGLFCSSSVIAEITVEPFGFAVSVEENGDPVEVDVILRNSRNDDVAFEIELEEIEEEQRGGPRRDDRGDPDDAGYFWVDDDEEDGPEFDWIDIVNRDGAERLQAGNNWNSGELELGFEFPWYGEWYPSVRVCTNGWFTFDPEQDGVFNVFPEFPDNDAPNNILAVDGFALTLMDMSSLWFWTDGEGLAVISWISMAVPIGPIRCEITMQAVLIAETGTVLYQYGNQIGLPANLVNVGYENQDGELGASIYFHQAVAQGLAIAISGPFAKWLIVEPLEGVIPAEDSQNLDVSFMPEDMEVGTHEMRVTIELSDVDDEQERTFIELSAVMTVDDPVYTITGVVTEAAFNEIIESASISMEPYLITRFSDNEGNYIIENIPPGNYTLTFTAVDFLPTTEELTIEADDVELDIALLHSVCLPSEESFNRTLEPDQELAIDFNVDNDGNGPLTYRVERRLLGEANAEPWELRSMYDTEQAVEDDMINGVTFAEGHFYVSGGNNGNNPNMIYVFDSEGEHVGNFEQVHESRYGMRDLTYDGNLIWGSDDNVLYGYNLNGEHVATLEGDAQSYRSLTWDPVNEWFWSADITSDFFATDVNGDLVQTVGRPGDIRIYGLGFWPNDPDGHNLYVFNRGDGIDIAVYKINLDNGEAILAAEIDVDDSRPGGIHITNQLDIYSWVLMGIVQSPDRLGVWQPEGRREWFQIAPEAGEIAARGDQAFVLDLNAIGLPPFNDFNGELVFIHDGVHGETHIPITLRVVEGEVRTFRELDLHIGWNTISVNLLPDNHEDIRVVMSALVEENLLIMMKNGAGEFYIPEYDFCNIRGWFAPQGYQLKMRSEAIFRLDGMSVLRDAEISLSEGWQLISYFPRSPVEATIALSGIEEHLIIAKDGYGNFYIPDWDFSNMGDMREGQGYYVNVDTGVVLVYRQERPDDEGAFTGVRHSSVYDEPGQLPVHPVTGSNMSLLVLADPTLQSRGGIDANTPPLRSRGGTKGGVEVGIYTSGKLVGSGVLQNGICGISVWGDDSSTDEINGALEGQLLEIRLLTGEGGHSCPPPYNSESAVDYTLLSGEAIYHTDGFAVVQLTASSIVPVEFGISSAYPNPFNSVMKISYGLVEAGDVSLNVYDLTGRHVAELVHGNFKAGIHNTVFDGTDLSSGIYLLRLESGSEVSMVKVALVK